MSNSFSLHLLNNKIEEKSSNIMSERAFKIRGVEQNCQIRSFYDASDLNTKKFRALMH